MKAIIVVDVEEYGEYYVDLYHKDDGDRFEGRYYLKPMPKESIDMPNDEECMKHYKRGRNDVIAEIKG